MFFKFQVKAFVTQVEQSAKKQLKSKSSQQQPINPKHHHQSSWENHEPTISVVQSKAKSSKKAPITAQETDHVMKERKDSKAMVLAASKTPNGFATSDEAPEIPPAPVTGVHVPSPVPPKPQFYFGQTMTDLVRKSSASNKSYQSAIDKVKQNEALSHPKRGEAEKLAAVTAQIKKGRHMSIITVTDEPNSLR